MTADNFTKRDLNKLLNTQAAVCVSIYIPTKTSGPEKRKNHIRFKNHIQKAKNELDLMGLDPITVKHYFSQADEITDDLDYWNNQSDGFCAFISNNFFTSYRLPVKFEEIVYVGERYFIKPLLNYLNNNDRFFVLAVSLGDVKLYKCDLYNCIDITPKETPKNLNEFLKLEDLEKQLQFHTQTPTQGTSRSAQYFGQSLTMDVKKQLMLRFFKRIDKTIYDLIKTEEDPVIFAGIRYHKDMYEQINSYKNLSEEFLAGNFEKKDLNSLHQSAVEIIKKLNTLKEKEVLENYNISKPRGLTTSIPDEILNFALSGKVDTLITSDNQPHINRAKDTLKDKYEDIYDLAAQSIIKTKGKVILLPRAKIPGNNKAVAILRQ